MSFQRKMQRQQEHQMSDDDRLTEAQKRYPTGQVLSSPLKGNFSTFPLLGWMSVRAHESIPLVMLALALLRDDKICGTLQVEIPIYENETDKAALAALKRYGWTGLVWSPGDSNWPTGDEINEEQHKMLLEQANLQATLTFPPDAETGMSRIQDVEVMRVKGPFLMEPLPEPEEEPDPQELADFLLLCRDMARFHKIGGN